MGPMADYLAVSRTTVAHIYRTESHGNILHVLLAEAQVGPACRPLLNLAAARISARQAHPEI